VGLDVVALPDDGMVIDDNVGRTFDKNDGLETVPASFINIFPYHGQPHGLNLL
jgi:hypothetical protein